MASQSRRKRLEAQIFVLL